MDALLRAARGGRYSGPTRKVEGPESLNPLVEGLGNTNSASQTGLETIAMLGTVGEHLRAELPPEARKERE